MTEKIDLDAIELRAMRFHKLNPLHECFDSTTVLALVAELRQEREQADEAEARDPSVIALGQYRDNLRLEVERVAKEYTRANQAEADLARAQETITRVDSALRGDGRSSVLVVAAQGIINRYWEGIEND